VAYFLGYPVDIQDDDNYGPNVPLNPSRPFVIFSVSSVTFVRELPRLCKRLAVDSKNVSHHHSDRWPSSLPRRWQWWALVEKVVNLNYFSTNFKLLVELLKIAQLNYNANNSNIASQAVCNVYCLLPGCHQRPDKAPKLSEKFLDTIHKRSRPEAWIT